MYRNLRIIFCILAVVCAAVTVFIFVFYGFWGFVPLAGGITFGFLMVFFKRLQEEDDAKKNPPAARGDFIAGKVKSGDGEKDE